jgi:hypothetical protein
LPQRPLSPDSVLGGAGAAAEGEQMALRRSARAPTTVASTTAASLAQTQTKPAVAASAPFEEELERVVSLLEMILGTKERTLAEVERAETATQEALRRARNRVGENKGQPAAGSQRRGGGDL